MPFDISLDLQALLHLFGVTLSIMQSHTISRQSPIKSIQPLKAQMSFHKYLGVKLCSEQDFHGARTALTVHAWSAI